VAEAQPTWLRVRLFSSQPKPGNYEVTLDTSRQVLRLDIPEDYKYDFPGLAMTETAYDHCDGIAVL